MNELKNCSTAINTLLWIWLLSGLSVCLFIILAIFYQKIYSHNNFDSARLNRIHDAGIVVIGNSLTACSFPYDEAMEKIAKKAGMQLQFVRFALPGAEPADFILLLKSILLAKPKWVFVQIGPFIAVNPAHDALQTLSLDVHHFLALILHHGSNNFSFQQQQSDNTLTVKMDAVAQSVSYSRTTHFLADPILPPPYQEFLQAARKQGIHVIFLHINHSNESNVLQGVTFQHAEEQALHILSKKYHLEVWRSPSLPLPYYTDGSHLNTAGRLVFTTWFLKRFKNELLDH